MIVNVSQNSTGLLSLPAENIDVKGQIVPTSEKAMGKSEAPSSNMTSNAENLTFEIGDCSAQDQDKDENDTSKALSNLGNNVDLDSFIPSLCQEPSNSSVNDDAADKS